MENIVVVDDQRHLLSHRTSRAPGCGGDDGLGIPATIAVMGVADIEIFDEDDMNGVVGVDNETAGYLIGRKRDIGLKGLGLPYGVAVCVLQRPSRIVVVPGVTDVGIVVCIDGDRGGTPDFVFAKINRLVGDRRGGARFVNTPFVAAARVIASSTVFTVTGGVDAFLVALGGSAGTASITTSGSAARGIAVVTGVTTFAAVMDIRGDVDALTGADLFGRIVADVVAALESTNRFGAGDGFVAAIVTVEAVLDAVISIHASAVTVGSPFRTALVGAFAIITDFVGLAVLVTATTIVGVGGSIDALPLARFEVTNAFAVSIVAVLVGPTGNIATATMAVMSHDIDTDGSAGLIAVVALEAFGNADPVDALLVVGALVINRTIGFAAVAELREIPE